MPCCCLLPLRAVAHLLMGVMVYYWVQHENKAISSRFADLPATPCVAVYYHWQRTAELVRQQSFGCVADLSFPLLPRADRRLFDRSLVVQRGFKRFHLMSRFITAFPPLPMLVTWWFITVLQPPPKPITSRFIHLGDAFAVVLYYRFAIGREWFSACESSPSPLCAWVAEGFKSDICMRICRCIYIY